MILEFSQYLENYLWPHYEKFESTFAHMMSIVCMLNEKFRERVPAWDVSNILRYCMNQIQLFFILTA
jgi:hypothetical protein